MSATSHLRADARRHHELIVNTARTVFAEQGPEAAMDEVARLAGVGPAVLYRHFPDRDALVRAVLEDALERMTDLAESARTEETWAFDALSRFVRGCAELRLDPLVSVIGTRIAIGDGGARLLEALERIVDAAHHEGALREDVGAGDVMGAVGLLVRGLPTLPAGLAQDLRERTAHLVLAGMRAHPAPAPPRSPMTAEELRRRITG
ncbi:TetR/AcrR family transcriptional regulator [Nonomuraea sp. SYSU D8015]|uniref:TetR/AcrR family transcriptional regulator n=1 Tax=Nonomuraea sp. SYSU D8015 TaxID=2593644 RepID=UPI001661770F|nr:TetR/AcrR family transcriptional regulator [Nonomuraea sp. SYSU D8015]